MSNRLSPQQVGGRIRRIREENGYSQEDIAKMLQVSRSSVVQMEKGNRQISVIELTLLSDFLGFSMDQFLTRPYEKSSESLVAEEPEIEIEKVAMRDSVPKLKRSKLDTVILYLTEKCGAKPRMEISLLLNLLYFCDFNHFELHEEQLTGLLYTKQPHGPSPENISPILKEMETGEKLHKIKSSYKGIPHYKYLPGVDANLMKLSAAEKEVIDRVIGQFSGWPSKALSHYAQDDMPFRATKSGEPIDYDLVFYRRPPYSVRVYDEDWSEE
jgi:transcriptional regulator with XRE-family HTH domain